MSRSSRVIHRAVEYIPEHLSEGVLYVSHRYATASHLCCCGCGEEVITPLGPTEWSIQLDLSGPTLHPSIGNWSYACRSHYWIRRGQVIWAKQMSSSEIELGRARDRLAKEAYFASKSKLKHQHRVFIVLKPNTWIRWLRTWLRR